jgi:hypothetical protein
MAFWRDLAEWLRDCPISPFKRVRHSGEPDEAAGGVGWEDWSDEEEWIASQEDWEPIDTNEGGYAEDVFLKDRHEN